MSHKFYTQWCSLFQHYIDRHKMTHSEFAERAGTSQPVIHTYITGRSKPQLNDLDRWCDVLELKGREREQFVWLAHEAHTPAVVWEQVSKLQRLLLAAEAAQADVAAEFAALKAEVTDLRLKHGRSAD